MGVITDGQICDMQDTIDAIVDLSKLPVSIVIVGVGNADFGTMDQLDADDHPLINSKGIKCVRDIVQFVPFNKYATIERLRAAVLDEIPGQVEQFMTQNGIKPHMFTKREDAKVVDYNVTAY